VDGIENSHIESGDPWLASLRNIPKKCPVVLLLPRLLRGARGDSTPRAARLLTVAKGISCRGGEPLGDTVNGFFVIESADCPDNAAILSIVQGFSKMFNNLHLHANNPGTNREYDTS
jgi:hypothetical protein